MGMVYVGMKVGNPSGGDMVSVPDVLVDYRGIPYRFARTVCWPTSMWNQRRRSKLN